VLLTWYAPILVFPSVLERVPVRCSPRGATFLPEVAFARGPITEGQTGAGSLEDLFSRVWALVWRRAGGLELYQLEAGAWYQRNPLGAIPELTETSRHVSLAFDQSGRPVVAWEDQAQVYVRQYDTALLNYVTRGPFPGVDPLLVCDALLLREIPGSDVVLFHLMADRLGVVSRIQNSLYGIPSTISVLEEPAFMDQIVIRPVQLELVFGTVSGLEFGLRTGPYPYAATDALSAVSLGIPSGAALIPLIVPYDAGTDALATASFAVPAGAALELLVISVDVGTDALGAASFAVPAGAALELLVISVDVGTDALGAASFAVPAGAALEIYVTVADVGTDQVSAVQFVPPAGAILEVI
jgi:hypothetical protein